MLYVLNLNRCSFSPDPVGGKNRNREQSRDSRGGYVKLNVFQRKTNRWSVITETDDDDGGGGGEGCKWREKTPQKLTDGISALLF